MNAQITKSGKSQNSDEFYSTLNGGVCLCFVITVEHLQDTNSNL